MQKPGNIKLINAGAGSGKTYTISQKVLKYIKEDGGSVSEILVTTFTKKAAQELRERIMEDLTKNHLVQEGMKVDDAWIGTVHALGKRLIDLFTFEAGYAPDQEVISEEDEGILFGQVIADTLEDTDYTEFTDLAAELKVIDWQQDILSIIKKARENNIDLGDHEDLAGQSIDRFNEFIGQYLHTTGYQEVGLVVNAFRSIVTELTGITDKRFKKHHEVIALAEEIISAYENNASVNTGLFFQALEKAEKLSSKNEETAEIIASALDEFLACYNFCFIQSYRKPFDQLYGQYISKLFESASRIYAAYIKHKKERGIVDYTDQEHEFLQLPTREPVREYISDKFKLMMVDEFQDTNPMQLAIFMQLAGLINKVYFVGDPKQSIYAFRGTDPDLLDNVASRIDVEDRLDVSRRSRHSLVSFTNNLFAGGNKFPQLDKEDIELKPWDELADGDGLNTAIQMWSKGEVDNAREGKLKVAGYLHGMIENRSLLYRDKGSKEIRPLEFGQVAILCRTNASVTEWAGVFEELGIEVSAERPGLLQQAEVIFLLAAAGYLADKSNSLSVAELVLLGDSRYAGRMEDIIDDRLQYLQEGGKKWMRDNELIKEIDLFRKAAENLGVKEIFEQLVVRLDMYGLASCWGKPSVRKANIQRMIKLAEEYENRCLTWSAAISLQGFIQWIMSKNDLNQQPSGSHNAVKVLTYYAAKGLEWPLVILDDLHKDPILKWWGTFVESDRIDFDLFDPLSSRKIYFIHNPFGTGYDYLSGGEAYKEAPDLMMDHIHGTQHMRRIRGQRMDEDVRILYVGITRARDYLVFPTPMGSSDQGWWNRVAGPVFPGFFDQQNDFEAAGEVVQFKMLPDVISPGDEAPPALRDYFETPAGKSDKEALPKYISTSGLESDEAEEKYSEYFEITTRFQTGRIKGAKEETDLGNAIHSIMTTWVQDIDRTERIARIEQILIGYGLETQVVAQEVDKRASEFFEWLNSQYPNNKLYRELPLRMVKEGQVYSGIADLLVETKEGFILFDYKSFQGEDVLKHSGRYSEQLDCYEKMINSKHDKKILASYLFYPITAYLVKSKVKIPA